MPFRSIKHVLAVLTILAAIAALPACHAASAKDAALPDPAVDNSLAAKSGKETAVLAGGCFWGIQLVYQHVKGVKKVTVGYSGGSAKSADYETVSTGGTGHAESVKIVYDPSQITYGQILKVFFSVAHNPTELNRQGPDTGTQYRSAIFYANPDQQRIAQAYILQLNLAGAFPRKIVTQVVPFERFYEAEAYHQNYATHHPHDPYIMMNDLPKLARLRKQLPALYVENR
jgi:peptide-methionine (S)-S-oxide reductase